MFSTARIVEEESREERLAAWRLERQKVAELQRRQRIEEQEQAKQKADVQANEETAKAADEAKPSLEEVEAVDTAIKRWRLRAKAKAIAQFSVIVLAPVALAGWYLWSVATPLYEAKTVFYYERSAADQPDPTTATPFSTRAGQGLQPAFAANSFIASDAMSTYLEAQDGLMTQLSSSEIDPLQRLRNLPALGITERDLIERFVSSDVDIQTGFVTLKVRADDPTYAAEISASILGVLNDRLAADQSAYASDALSNASRQLTQAEELLRTQRRRLNDLQVTYRMSDPIVVLNQRTAEISALEAEIAGLSAEIRRLQVSGRGDQFRTQQAQTLIDTLNTEIDRLQTGIVDGSPSLPQIITLFETAKLEIALAERQLETAHASMAQLENAITAERVDLRIVAPTGTTNIPVYPNKLGSLAVIFILALTVFCFARLTVLRPKNILA